MARGLIAAGAVATAGLMGCGTSPVRDIDRLEAEIPAALVPDAPEVVSDVACPGPVVEGPRTFVCAATVNGVDVDVTVDASFDDRAVVSTDAVLVDVDTMAAAGARRLTDELDLATSVDCPGPPVVVAESGLELVCGATDPAGIERDVRFTLIDDSGAWRLEIVS